MLEKSTIVLSNDGLLFPSPVTPGAVTARAVFRFAANSAGTFVARLTNASGILAVAYVIPAADVAPTTLWDLTIADDAGNALYTNTSLSSTAQTAAVIDYPAAGAIVLTVANMGSGGRAQVTLVFTS